MVFYIVTKCTFDRMPGNGFTNEVLGVVTLDLHHATFRDVRAAIQNEINPGALPARWVFLLPPPLQSVYHEQEMLFGPMQVKAYSSYNVGDGTQADPFRLVLVESLERSFPDLQPPQIQVPQGDTETFKDELKRKLLSQRTKLTMKQTLAYVKAIHKGRRHHATDKLKQDHITQIVCLNPGCKFKLCFSYLRSERATEAKVWVTKNSEYVHDCRGDEVNDSR